VHVKEATPGHSFYRAKEDAFYGIVQIEDCNGGLLLIKRLYDALQGLRDIFPGQLNLLFVPWILLLNFLSIVQVLAVQRSQASPAIHSGHLPKTE
jgi:hypothetical protein